MGCVCCSLSSFVSIILDALERISLCTVCAMLTCCLLFTIISMMVLGIGIGFHYCFVQNSVDAMAKAAKATGVGRRSGGGDHGVPSGVVRSLDHAVRRFGQQNERARREAQPPPPLPLNATDLQLGSVDLNSIEDPKPLDLGPIPKENERARREAQSAPPITNPQGNLNMSHIPPDANPHEAFLNLSHIRQSLQILSSLNQTLLDNTFFTENQPMNISSEDQIQNPVPSSERVK